MDIDWLVLVISHSFSFRGMLMQWYSTGLLIINGTVKLCYRSLTQSEIKGSPSYIEALSYVKQIQLIYPSSNAALWPAPVLALHLP